MNSKALHQRRAGFLFLNLGHFLDHLLMLVFASVAALSLTREWGISYAGLIPYATPGFVAFGVGAIAAGWLADKWSREGMMVIFFIGIGLSSILASTADTPMEIGICLTLIGLFAAIYHPVGLALVVQGRERTGIPLAVNGVFGNMGVACAALFSGFLIDQSGWRSAFVVPGVFSVLLGLLYLSYIRRSSREDTGSAGGSTKAVGHHSSTSSTLARVFSVIFLSTAIGGLVFQSTTFALPRVFEEQLPGTATAIGGYAFIVFSIAALAQLVVGYLVDNYAVRPVFVMVATVQLIFFVTMTQVDGLLAVLIATGFMLAVFGQIPINDVLVGRFVREEWRSRIYALRYVVTFSVMASTVPLIAWIHANGGFEFLFKVLAVAAGAILVTVMFLPHSRSAT